MLVCRLVPEVYKRDRFMSKSPVHIAHAGLVSVQIENGELTEAFWYTSDHYQFSGGQPPTPAMAGGASFRCLRRHSE